jgi:hypothetical protein
VLTENLNIYLNNNKYKVQLQKYYLWEKHTSAYKSHMFILISSLLTVRIPWYSHILFPVQRVDALRIKRCFLNRIDYVTSSGRMILVTNYLR